MPKIEILAITRAKPDVAALWGCNLEKPARQQPGPVYALEIAGWALGRKAPVSKIEVHCNGLLIKTRLLTIRRPDIASGHKHVPDAARSGFGFGLSSLEIPDQFTITVQAVLEDNTCALIGTIDGTRAALRPSEKPALQPAMITTLGRTGSTWLTQLLGEHSEILSYRPFAREARVGSYWLAILRTLSDPDSFLNCLGADLSDKLWWAGAGARIARLEDTDPELIEVLAEANLQCLAGFCIRRVDAFYARFATLQHKPSARYFTEKVTPDAASSLLREIYPEARELVLVRDFRDMLTSVLAFNAKRGVAEFDRAAVSSDEDYVHHLRKAWAIPLLESWKRRSGTAWLVRYEDLIQRPEETLTGILRHLGVEAAPDVVKAVVERASRDTPGMQRHRTSSSPAASIGRWRRELSPALQSACETAFRDILPEFGYGE